MLEHPFAAQFLPEIKLLGPQTLLVVPGRLGLKLQISCSCNGFAGWKSLEHGSRLVSFCSFFNQLLLIGSLGGAHQRPPTQVVFHRVQNDFWWLGLLQFNWVGVCVELDRRGGHFLVKPVVRRLVFKVSNSLGLRRDELLLFLEVA